ncbi:MAG TPA: pseudouridine-5'-phosphate glycosidase [Actinomycetota bacterium]|nr:pseudouridine-5'-phosphate glycosidase [Actinomycetota bacterium]
MTDRVDPSDEVREALRSGAPVVALETSVLAHGLPDPWNRQAAEAMDRAIREHGAVPAWTWVGDGRIRIGTGPGDLDPLLEGRAGKVARRDLPPQLAARGLGATTVSALLWAASRAGIEVAATGGIGGVHPGAGDVSPDLVELGRTPGTLVCSGPKSILDPAATLERLEELGVGVLGYRCERLPFFLVREAPLDLEHRAEQPAEVAAVAAARQDLRVESTLLVCNPCPPEVALPADRVAQAVARCLERTAGARGKEVTPFLLACLAEETGGDSLRANLALLESNSALAARIAAALV